ncbi:MAG: class IV adenylate cyclase [Spirochaetaceae bacterium]|jgi:adenylate cyclase class 2|nr:class IV adenylate cyclase [Spirochaetaceae bacterium]
MPVEIEVKAWADDPEKIKSALSCLAEYRGKFRKQDEYWFTPSVPSASEAGGIPASGVRVRREEAGDAEGAVRKRIVVTYKVKEVRDGIEINQEREFLVSDKGALEELLSRLGLARGYAKEKSGFAWNYHGITAELTRVAPLGWFAELEILTGDDAEPAVQSARHRLMDLLHRIGIGEDRIETRYYSEMLQTKGRASGAGEA